MLGVVRRRTLPNDRALTGLVAGAALMIVLAGCGGDGSTALKTAEARVSAKEQAVTDAKADFAEKSAQFCDASQSYIMALDRYGDVLTQSAPTVGDVSDAGTDLDQPREEAMAGAEAAVEAQQAITDAKHELARRPSRP